MKIYNSKRPRFAMTKRQSHERLHKCQAKEKWFHVFILAFFLLLFFFTSRSRSPEQIFFFLFLKKHRRVAKKEILKARLQTSLSRTVSIFDNEEGQKQDRRTLSASGKGK